MEANIIQQQLSQSGYKVELFLTCKNLTNFETANKQISVLVYIKPRVDPLAWYKIAQTEKVDIQNSSNHSMQSKIDFKTSIIISYQFEIHQPLKFELQGIDKNLQPLTLGNIETSLGTIVGAKDQTFEGPLLKITQKQSHPEEQVKEQAGLIQVTVSKVNDSNIEILMKVGAKKLPKYRSCWCFCCPQINPSLEISKSVKAGEQVQYHPVFKTEIIQGQQNQDPLFRPFKLKGQQACNSDFNAPIQFKFQNEVYGEMKDIGVVVKSINELQKGKEFPITAIESQNPAGTMHLHDIKIIEKPSFLQYMQAGWEINVTVAIDFTASNGLIHMRDSLHYLGGFNQYEHAINSVCSILEHYDMNKAFPVYGFGGTPRFMNWTQPSHCFPLTGNTLNPEVFGTRGILQTYRQNLQGITLSGPTFFQHILRQFSDSCQQKLQRKVYSILLILTDGNIHDMSETKRLLVEASELPCSVIIVGVGNEKFKLMRELDSEEAILRDDAGRTSQRDIVQFVKFKKYYQLGADVLAEQVLKNIPDQLVSYMMLKNIYPPGFELKIQSKEEK